MSDTFTVSESLLQSTSYFELNSEIKKIFADLVSSHQKLICLYHQTETPSCWFYPQNDQPKNKFFEKIYLDSIDYPNFFNLLESKSFFLNSPNNIDHVPTYIKNETLPESIAQFFQSSEKIYPFTISTNSNSSLDSPRTYATLLSSDDLAQSSQSRLKQLNNLLLPLLEKIKIQQKMEYQQKAWNDFLNWTKNRLLDKEGFNQEKSLSIIQNQLSIFFRASIYVYYFKTDLDPPSLQLIMSPYFSNSEPHKFDLFCRPLAISDIDLDFYKKKDCEIIIHEASRKKASYLSLRFLLYFSSRHFLFEIIRPKNHKKNHQNFCDSEIIYLKQLVKIIRQQFSRTQKTTSIPANQKSTNYLNSETLKTVSTEVNTQIEHYSTNDHYQIFFNNQTTPFPNYLNLLKQKKSKEIFKNYFLSFDPGNESEKNFFLEKTASYFFKISKSIELFLNHYQGFLQKNLDSFSITNYGLITLKKNGEQTILNYQVHQFEILYYQFETGYLEALPHTTTNTATTFFSENPSLDLQEMSIQENDILIISLPVSSSVFTSKRLSEISREISLNSFLDAEKIGKKIQSHFFHSNHFFELIKIK